MALLRILTGSLEGQEFDLPPDETFIGRGSSCQVRISDQGVSSKHAKIWSEDGLWFLMDLGSTNGTFVNEKDVDREPLNDADEITFGMTKAKFVGDAPKPKTSSRSSSTSSARPSSNTASAATAARAAPPSRPSLASAPLRADVRTSDEVELQTLRGKVAFFEEENRKLKAQMKQVQEQAANEASAGARGDAERIRATLKQKEAELKEVRKELEEKDTYYSPAELERERKRMEAAIEADRRREVETLQRQIKESEHRIAIRGAESDTVARQLKEKDDLIKMLSEREDEVQAEIKARDEKIGALQEEHKQLREVANAAAGKEKELNDKVKQKNLQLASLGKERTDLVQDVTKARSIIAKLGGGGEAAAAVDEQMKASKAMQDTIAKLEGEISKTKDEMSAMQGKALQTEGAMKDLKKQLEEAEAQMTDALDARAKLEGQVSEMLKNPGDRDSHEKQMAMLKADRDAKQKEAKEANDKATAFEAQLAKIRGTYDDIVRERDIVKSKLDGFEAEKRMAATGNKLSSDWEARYKSAQDEIAELRKQAVKSKQELGTVKEQAAKGGGAGDETQLKLSNARGDLHFSLVSQMMEQVNNAVSLLRRNSELMRGYVEDCGLLANAVRRVDYTKLEPDQQQMLVELIDQTQPDVIVKNMQGISDENTDSIGKAKKLILDYTEAFKKEHKKDEAVGVVGVEIESTFARAQGLLHSSDSTANVALKIESALPRIEADKDEAVLFAFAVLSEADSLVIDGKPPSVRIDTDGLTVTVNVLAVNDKTRDRYRDPPDPQSRLIRGFAVDRCGGKVEVNEENNVTVLAVTLKAKI